MYIVVWEPAATDHFAAISMAYTNRWADINAADNDIANKLRRDPLQFSQPVSEGLHRIASDPLGVLFSIEGNLVHVESVGWVG